MEQSNVRGLIVVIGLMMIAMGSGAYKGYLLWQEYVNFKQESTVVITDLKTHISDLDGIIVGLKLEKEGLETNLQDEKNRNDGIAKQVQDIAGTVGILEKLENTDEELLQKYSKVYFLNENYVPDLLTDIEATFTLSADKKILIHSKTWPFLKDLLIAAKNDGVEMKVLSGFRSFDEQSSLKSTYKVTYGSGANQFSADQGYSEHQLGTTVDLTTLAIGGAYNSFAQSNAYKWMVANAYKYGFVLSYPAGNKYYLFEPWHWRFVGKDLASDLHRDGKNFYDLDQREIDKYLVSIFD